MPLPATMATLARLCRLTPAEARALQMLCCGRSIAAIAEALDVSSRQARRIVRAGQRRARNARPWMRPAHTWEQRREVAVYWERARCLAEADALDELEPYSPPARSVDDDLRADARAILDAIRNREMMAWMPSSGPRLPGPRTITPQQLAERWIECLTGGVARSGGQALSDVVIESIRRRYYRDDHPQSR